MKKFILRCFLVAMVVCLVPQLAWARVHTVQGIKIILEDSYYPITQNVRDDDPVLTKYKIPIKQLRDKMIATGMYLDALSIANRDEITVVVKHDASLWQIGDLNNVTNKQMQELKEVFVPQIAKVGITVTKTEEYIHNGVRYLRIDGVSKTGNRAVSEYLTIKNSICYAFAMSTIGTGTMTSAQQLRLKNAVDSVVY